MWLNLPKLAHISIVALATFDRRRWRKLQQHSVACLLSLEYVWPSEVTWPSQKYRTILLAGPLRPSLLARPLSLWESRYYFQASNRTDTIVRCSNTLEDGTKVMNGCGSRKEGTRDWPPSLPARILTARLMNLLRGPITRSMIRAERYPDQLSVSQVVGIIQAWIEITNFLKQLVVKVSDVSHGEVFDRFVATRHHG